MPTAGLTQHLRQAVLWGVGTFVVLVAAIVVRVVTISPSHASVHVTVASSVQLSGSAPTPAWPASGQAALTVQGIGSLGSSAGETPEPTASLAKVMTAYLTLKKYPLSGDSGGFSLTVTAADVQALHADTAEDQSVVAVRAGETLNERQLLEALLIPSGDNIAVMLAAHEAGSVAAFLTEMNDTARSLGMDHTTYTDPSGFATTTVSTAADQLRVFQRAMRSKVFRQIVSMASATLPVAGTVTNYDPLLSAGYNGKTGSDSAAEGCLAFFKYVRVAGRRLTVVGVVMGQGTGSSTSVILGAAGDAAVDLVDSVVPSIKLRTVVAAHSAVMVVRSADGNETRALSTGALKVIGWGGLRESLSASTATAGVSVVAGQNVGELSLSGHLPEAASAATRTTVEAATALGSPGLGWRLAHLF